MAVTVYKSSDASAPVLSGTVGSLITVLDACLVNGYGSKTAAGWTKPFSGTNAAVYLGTAGHYLDVNDAAGGAAGAQEANVRGYESMTAVGTGTNPFPTVAQAASPGHNIRKSATADASARAWVIFADGTTFHLFILSGDTVNRYQSFTFGRVYSFKTSDAYRSFIWAHQTSGGSGSGMDVASLSQSGGSGINGAFVPRVHAGTGTSSGVGVFGVGSSAYGQAVFSGPNSADGLIYLSRLFISNDTTVTGGLRGYLRGLYQIVTGTGLNDGDTFSGTGDFAGRTFTVVARSVNGAYFAVETSAWDSSS